MATHSGTLAGKILWTEKPGRLQSMGSQKSQIRLHFHFHCHQLVAGLWANSLVWSLSVPASSLIK